MRSEKINFKMSIPGGGKNFIDRSFTLKQVLEWLDTKPLENVVKEELKKMVKRYPQQALDNWVKNYNKHVSKAQKKINQERR